ncbi:hypothetical protein PJ985_15795 [Streptomyces sp. ACA25]|uniref:hypothetical protein n=1 Tax=Streptomyces sp. ACA25 TaxID=3022596 RepID=UPI0023075BEC|nr:hypothetical protein [Streptomyces sp. ACA25]MDB1089024.1 hypothetical protein [Streptomyces sp. ACA25]
MQPTAGPDLAPTPTRAVHWIVTAAALAVVAGGAALVQPPDATASPAAASGGPNPEAAAYPLDCPDGIAVTDRAVGDLDGDGRPETFAAVRCDTGTGTPPSGLYVLTGPPAGEGPPRVAEVLVDPEDGMTVQQLTVENGSVSVVLLGYSSPEVPRCCPDQEGRASWHWENGGLVRTQATPMTTADA